MSREVMLSPRSHIPLLGSVSGHGKTMSNGTVIFWIVIATIGASFGALHGAMFNDGPTLPASSTARESARW